MPRLLRDALLVFSGVLATLLVLSGMPAMGLLLYGPDFKAAYADCATAKANAVRIKPSSVSEKTNERFRKTVLVDEFRCLYSQVLYDRLRQFSVSDSTINGMEMDAKLKDAEVNQ
jgi:hypothetical protein